MAQRAIPRASTGTRRLRRPRSTSFSISTAKAHPRRTCTNFLGKILTYGDIAAMVDRTAAGLQKLGVKKGTKVGLFLPNCPTFIIYYFAMLKAGGTVVNYNPLYTLEELTFQVKDSETELMVTLDLKVLFDKVEGLMKAGTLKRAIVASFPALLPGAKVRPVQAVQGQGPGRTRRSRRWRQASSWTPTCWPTTASTAEGRRSTRVNDVAVLQYTGGTTGTPKGAMLTHANVYINVSRASPGRPTCSRGAGAGAGGPALLPRVRHDRRDELRASPRAPRSSSCRASCSTTP